MKFNSALSEKYDVIIIGSGCGGSAAAALASFNGYRTLLLEKNNLVGGRACTRDIQGFKLDHGHIVLRGDKGPHALVLKSIKCEDLIPKYALLKDLSYRTMFLGQVWEHSKQSDKRGFRSLRRNIQRSTLSIAEIPALALLSVQLKLRAIRENDNWKGLDRVSARSLLLEYTDNEVIDIGLAALTCGCFGVLSDQASCGEWIRTTQDIIRDDSVGYPVNGEGISAIPNSLLRAAERYGATIALEAPVERVVVKQGAVRGVSVGGKLVRSDIVISNAGIKETAFHLVGRSYFDQTYIEYLEKLSYSSGAISLGYALDRPIVDFHVGFKVPSAFYRNIRDSYDGRLPEQTMMVLICTSNIDPLLAPRGKQVLLVTAHCPAVRAGKIDWSPWIESVKRQVEEFVPGLSRHTIFCQATSPDALARENGRILGDAMGVAQTVEQVGELTPPSASPIKGLYQVGADVCSKGVGTEMATQSAIDLFNFLA
ncbi:MAG: NAD(P)/FAD-dependent oxidoreductase [Deltaproteobacteria bacterium]|nr:NAD(P)/FAD-dependent oxidoreductase [Deltaproteobacteria bacterium]